MIKNLFTKHTREVNETYLRHLWFASCFGGQMILSGLACVIHGIFPFLFVHTGTNAMLKLAEKAQKRQDQAKAP